MYQGISTVQPELSLLSKTRPVSRILQSGNFRESLESMVITYRLSMTENRILSESTPAVLTADSSPTHPLPLPRRDTTGIIGDTVQFKQHSTQLRLMTVKLAVVCRLIDHFGWYLPTLVHCSARVDTATTLFTPLSMLFSSAKATSLLVLQRDSVVPDRKVDMYSLLLHQHLLSSYSCVITVNTPLCAAVASLSYGLLPLSRDYLQIGDVEYTDAEALKFYIPEARVIFIRNQGIAVVGSCVEEVFCRLFHVLTACAVQRIALTAGEDKILPIHLQNMLYNSIPDSSTQDNYESHFEHFSSIILDERIFSIAGTDISDSIVTNPFLSDMIENKNTNPFLPLAEDNVCDHDRLWDFTRYMYPIVDVWSFLPRTKDTFDNPITQNTEITVERTWSKSTEVYVIDDNDDLV